MPGRLGFEQIRLRGMAQSKHALRAETLEADDLRNVVPPAGTSRFVASVYRVPPRIRPLFRDSVRSHRQRSDRFGLTEILDWARIVIDGLNDKRLPVIVHPSICTTHRTFERRRDFVVPVTVAFNVHVLRQALLDEDAPYRLIRTQQTHTSIISTPMKPKLS